MLYEAQINMEYKIREIEIIMSDLEAHDPENILEKADLDWCSVEIWWIPWLVSLTTSKLTPARCE